MLYKTTISFDKNMMSKEIISEYPVALGGEFTQFTDVDGNIYTFKSSDILAIIEEPTKLNKDFS